jgi:hypothetical protein
VVVDEKMMGSTKRNHLCANIMFLPKKLGCDVVVKVPVPPLAVYYDEGIVRDDSSSDVIALEHIATALHLDSGCGEDGLLADVLFWNMMACCCGV